MPFEIIKRAVLGMLAYAVLLGGTLFLLFSGILPGENIFQTIKAIFGIAALIAVFYYLMARADPESLNNLFT